MTTPWFWFHCDHCRDLDCCPDGGRAGVPRTWWSCSPCMASPHPVRSPEGPEGTVALGNAWAYLVSSDFCGSGGGPTTGELHLGGICTRKRKVTIEHSQWGPPTILSPSLDDFSWGVTFLPLDTPMIATSILVLFSFKIPRRWV